MSGKRRGPGPPPRPYHTITFDCYGTLIDWEGGISEAFLAAAGAAGVTLERAAVLAAYAQVEPAVEAGAFRSYREVLTETAAEVARRLGWRLAPGAARFLAESLPAWKPFADTAPALQELRNAGYALGILSNVDDDLLAGTLRHLPVSFDLLITAQQVKSYKPAAGHFVATQQRLRGRRWLHAAQSYFHDVAPAVALGIPVVWVNRKGERPAGAARPDAEVPDLDGLVEWLERVSGER